jgi:lipopolysaccharide transport system ATP-binding protein
MSEVIIQSEGLGKKYRIGHRSPQVHVALRDVLAQQGHNLLRSLRDVVAGRALIEGDRHEDFWALRDVNFEIRRGDVVGIIGRNGAGKSTLLKVLSRITEPSEGRLTIHGRIASLLEVGTGFHPDLTGRENIYLNGAILGMNRSEIRRKFDEIVSFAGIEKFLDTPVKRYSSGMYVRLAFSVAAHLEPEILVVDEVLAVGDAEFQQKCLGKMHDVAGEGRTVLFVSHNMNAVASLCQKGILLQNGTVHHSGAIKDVIDVYASDNQSTALYADLHESERRRNSRKPIFTEIKISGTDDNYITNGGKFRVDIGLDLKDVPQYVRDKPEVNISVCDSSGRRIFTLMSQRQGAGGVKFSEEKIIVSALLNNLPLSPGIYNLELRFWTPGEQWDEVSPALIFEVYWKSDHNGVSNWDSNLGCVYIEPEWEFFPRQAFNSGSVG